MTVTQKKKITELRKQGYSYTDIAEIVKLPQGTVKSFCWRNQLSNADLFGKDEHHKGGCLNCGCVIVCQPDAPPRKYCSDRCREVWWSKHRKPNNSAVCAYCKKKFAYYGKAARKYCSQTCSVKARFGEGDT
jgi:hypothetical protein